MSGSSQIPVARIQKVKRWPELTSVHDTAIENHHRDGFPKIVTSDKWPDDPVDYNRSYHADSDGTSARGRDDSG